MRRLLLVLLLLPGLVAGCATVPPGGTAAGVGSGWERLPDGPLPPRTHPVLAAVGGRVLVVGGTELLCPPNADCSLPDTPPLRDGALLDPATGAWEPISDAPYPLPHAQTATVGDVVWLLAGSRLLSYDTTTDTWEEQASLPREVRYAELVAVPGGLVAAPTSDERHEVADHRFDVGSGTWEALPDDPLPLVYDRSFAVDGDRLLVLGSVIPEPDGDHDEPKVAAALDLGSGTWTRLPDAPSHGFQAWRVGREVWLNGHFGTDGPAILDLRTDTWRAGPAGPGADDWQRDMAGIFGDGRAHYEYAAGWVRDARADRWVRVPDRDADGVYDESVVAAGEDLVVVGGQRWDGDDGELVAEAWVWRP